VSATGVFTPPVPAADRGQYLSPAWRAHFESVGEDSVQFDVSNHNYHAPEKQLAALAWLAEKRAKRERRDRWTFRATFLVALLTLVATVYFGLR
jgi:hypothetical protein